MVDASPSQGMVAFLGVPADERLLDEDRLNLPAVSRAGDLHS